MLTRVLIAINVIAYLWQLTTGDINDARVLVHDGALYGPAVSAGQWWRVITSEFLHGGLFHIATNMFALYQVGTFIEALYGRVRMGAIYAFAMVGASMSALYFSYDIPTVGASGAIFGLFGALVAGGLQLGKQGRELVQQSVGIIVINLVLGFTIFRNVSNAAHIGGLVVGFVLGYLLFLTVPRRAVAEHAMVAAAPLETEAGVVYEPPAFVEGARGEMPTVRESHPHEPAPHEPNS